MASSDPRPYTVVVAPSISYDESTLAALEGAHHYEERFLIMMMILRDPRARLVYVTSEPVLPVIVDYYLHLLPGVIPSQARRRLFLFSTLDRSLKPLTQKLLQRPRLLQRLRDLIGDPERAYLVPFNTTELERELALRLDIPILGADPALMRFGSKSGSRKLFSELGVAHPAGYEDIRSMDEAAEAIGKLRGDKKGITTAVVKTNEGVSGLGNVEVSLRDLPPPGSSGEPEAIRRRLREDLGESYEQYSVWLERGGGIIEEHIEGEELRSPSAQLMITPSGEVQLLSTHDQLLSGPKGHNYWGCRFPADRQYAQIISKEARRIGARLAREGVVGRAAVDFVVVRDGRKWKPYAIEINLRQGGTTHPFLTLQFLTDGRYIHEEATFIAPNGRRKYFVASDHIESPLYRGFTPDDLFDIAARHKLHFDHAQQTGVVFHMMSALPERGRTGLTAVADSPEEAGWMCERVIEILNEEAKDAFHELDPDPQALPKGV